MTRSRSRSPAGRGRSGRCELLGALLVLAAAMMFLAANYPGAAGALGQLLGGAAYHLAGEGARVLWLPPLAAGGYLLWTGRPLRPSPRLFGLGLAWLLLQVFLHLGAPAGYEMRPEVLRTHGGWTGGVALRLLYLGFGSAGLWLALVGLSLLSGLLVLRLSPGRALGLMWRGLSWAARGLLGQVRDLVAAARAPRPGRPRPVGLEAAAGLEGRDGVPGGMEPLPPAGSSGVDLPLGDPAAPGGGPGWAPETASRGAPPAFPGPGARAPARAPAAAPPGAGAVRRPDEPVAAAGHRPYQLPPLDILRSSPRQRTGRAAQDAESRARLVEEAFASFGVGVKVMYTNPGPTVTRFEVRPAPGVKVARIESLADDIALSLAAADVRIAPIPGKGLVGVEVPNAEVSVVTLREVLDSAEFARASSRLTFAIGKDIAGQVIVADLERLLHLLIAGATGSGKSVCLNTLIASILFKARPDQVKLLLIDPKVVELQVYDGVPHLLAPVINDPKKAAQVLRWSVKEMLDRYYRFSEVGVRNIGDYNRLMEERSAGGLGDHGAGSPLAHIVIVIDELADLMMVAPAEVEDSIWRLAQMARAAGIHLVVATQRPSVNVITGVIKANIPSRIAFAVASQVDSRTILDIAGAEKLLGRGDMLFYPIGASKPVRAQGALITDREVEELVRYTRQQADPNYMESFPAPEDTGGGSDRELDAKWADALRVVFEHGQASTSMLQRRLKVGYTRAARMVDLMEEMGIVGKSDGVKPREVLMSMDQYAERYGPLDRVDRDILS